MSELPDLKLASAHDMRQQGHNVGAFPRRILTRALGLAKHDVVGQGGCKLLQCNGCLRQSALTAGSLMEHTKLQMRTWVLAIAHSRQAGTVLSALARKRQLGVR